ncbi:hypothetical protein ODD08_000238 [Salmonella enterica]|nr:hypothetical protein [Salmonella enterica]
MKQFLPILFIAAISGCSTPSSVVTPYQQPEAQPITHVSQPINVITKEQVKKLTNENLAFCEKNMNTYLDNTTYAPNTSACDTEAKYRIIHKKLTRAELNKDMEYAQQVNDMNAQIDEQTESMKKAISACYDNPVICHVHETEKTLNDGGF